MLNDTPEYPPPQRSAAPWTPGLGTAIGVIVASAVVGGMSPQVSVQVLSGACFGLVPGFLVYRFALRRDSERVGRIAVISCALAGGLMGLLLAIPTALAFYIMLRRRPLADSPTPRHDPKSLASS